MNVELDENRSVSVSMTSQTERQRSMLVVCCRTRLKIKRQAQIARAKVQNGVNCMHDEKLSPLDARLTSFHWSFKANGI